MMNHRCIQTADKYRLSMENLVFSIQKKHNKMFLFQMPHVFHNKMSAVFWCFNHIRGIGFVAVHSLSQLGGSKNNNSLGFPYSFYSCQFFNRRILEQI